MTMKRHNWTMKWHTLTIKRIKWDYKWINTWTLKGYNWTLTWYTITRNHTTSRNWVKTMLYWHKHQRSIKDQVFNIKDHTYSIKGPLTLVQSRSLRMSSWTRETWVLLPCIVWACLGSLCYFTTFAFYGWYRHYT